MYVRILHCVSSIIWMYNLFVNGLKDIANLATFAGNQITTASLLNRFVAFRTRLCICHKPILCFTVISTLLLPLVPPASFIFNRITITIILMESWDNALNIGSRSDLGGHPTYNLILPSTLHNCRPVKSGISSFLIIERPNHLLHWSIWEQGDNLAAN